MFEVGRVLSIVLDNKHEKYKGEESIGTICWAKLQDPPKESSSNTGCKGNLTAKPYWNNIGYYPIPNELVYIVQFPSPDFNNSTEESTFIHYYLPPGSIHKKPTSNILPNSLDENDNPYLGHYFKDLGNFVRPLRPYEGDIIFEGRFGQSIRFGATVDNLITSHPNPWSSTPKESIGNPITIIKNGQRGVPLDNKLHIIENINEDDSSIYLCSEQRINNFFPSSLHDESYGQEVFQDIEKEETIVDTENETMPSNTEEDIPLTTPDTLPAEELQTIDELSDLKDTETAYYDISPTESQIISANDTTILGNNYVIPDTVSMDFLNSNIETPFKKVHNIKSQIAELSSLNNYPGVDIDYDPSLTEEFIWSNLQKLHINCIMPIIDAFGIDNIRITSAYRSIAVNKALGGNPDSQHIKGYAVDLISTSHTSDELFNFCKTHLSEWNQLIWEFPERGDFITADRDFSWLHISYIEGNNPKTCTMSSEIELYHELMDEGYPDEMTRRGKYLHGIPEADDTIM